MYACVHACQVSAASRVCRSPSKQ